MILGLAVTSCDGAQNTAPVQKPEVGIDLNHAEIALVNFAHTRIGSDYSYSDETISDADGQTKVCGKFTRPDKPGVLVRYSYSLQGVRSYGPDEDRAWDSACSNGWMPGTGATE